LVGVQTGDAASTGLVGVHDGDSTGDSTGDAAGGVGGVGGSVDGGETSSYATSCRLLIGLADGRMGGCARVKK
jgi:hypothetical protein